MTPRYPLALPFSLLLTTVPALAQVPLAQLDIPVIIDFTNSVAGVNNGLFDAQTPIGSTAPVAGQIDYNGWNWVNDVSPSAAAQGPANFPGALPNGNGVGAVGNLTGGISAVDINGERALAIQPTSGVWTSGSLTLRASNNTGAALGQIEFSYDLFVYNDQVRSNDVRFYYSLSAAQDSWVEVLSAAVTSPAEPDATPAWVEQNISTTLSGFSMNPGDVIYLRWVGNDVSGSGTRDEFAITNIVLTPEAATGPNVVVSTTGLPPFAQIVGIPSAAQTFIAFGSLLVEDVTITAPAPFEVSINEGSGYASSLDLVQAGGTAGPATIYVRMNSTLPGPYNGVITVASSGAAGALVAVAGIASPATLPTIFINELMADNGTTLADENGEFDDWFELYNPSASAVDLAGWFVSDDSGDLMKYQFPPAGTQAVVPASGFLLVWADGQPTQGDLHTNFSLSSTSGETLFLVAPDGITVADSITFPVQSTGISYGRDTDGQLPWVTFSAPTPGASNNFSDLGGEAGIPVLAAWPNPVHGGALNLSRPVSGILRAADGRAVRTLRQEATMDLAGLSAGAYLLHTDTGAVLRVIMP